MVEMAGKWLESGCFSKAGVTDFVSKISGLSNWKGRIIIYYRWEAWGKKVWEEMCLLDAQVGLPGNGSLEGQGRSPGWS